MTAPVRIAGPGDAAALLRLKQSLDAETSFMLLETDERETSVQDLASELGAAAQSGNSVVIVADSGEELAGYVELTGGSFRRNRTTAYLVMGSGGRQAAGDWVPACWPRPNAGRQSARNACSSSTSCT